MGPDLQGALNALKWPNVFIADSLAMGSAAVEQAQNGVNAITVLGVDFMAENVRAALDAADYSHVPVYRLSRNEIGCSLSASAERKN